MPATPIATDVYLQPEVEEQIKNHLSRIQCQLEGVKRILDDRKGRDGILVQMAAARKAMNSAAGQLLENHMETCVRDSVERGDATEALDSLRGAMAKFLKNA